MSPREAIAALVFPWRGGLLVEHKRSRVRYWVDADVIALQCATTINGERVATAEDYVYGWREGNLRRRGRTLPSYRWFHLCNVRLVEDASIT